MFNKHTADELLSEIRDALEAVAAAQGLKVTLGTARYTRGNVRLTVDFAAQTDTGEPVNFRTDALYIGIPQGCWNTTIGIDRTQYRIVGINLRRRKYPVTVERKNDEGLVTLKMTPERVRALLGA